MKFLTDAFYVIKHSLLNTILSPVLGAASVAASWQESRSLSTITDEAGRIRITSDGTSTCGGSLRYENLEIGAVYRYRGSGFRGNSTGTVSIRVSTMIALAPDVPVNEAFANPLEPGEFSETFAATATTMYIGVISSGHGAGQFVELDNIKLERT